LLFSKRTQSCGSFFFSLFFSSFPHQTKNKNNIPHKPLSYKKKKRWCVLVEETFIYVISDGELIKVGISKNPKRRLKQLNTGSGRKLYLLCFFSGDRMEEKWIHTHFRRAKGEWLFCDEDILEYINERISEQDKFVEMMDGRPVCLLKIKK
jgi:hypothetical protein